MNRYVQIREYVYDVVRAQRAAFPTATDATITAEWLNSGQGQETDYQWEEI